MVIYDPTTPDYQGDQPGVFLAGGITGCNEWQQQLVGLLAGSQLVVFNPRQAMAPGRDIDAGRRQIAWEYRHLRRAKARLFWFPAETLCPIALFELGAWTTAGDPLFVGMDRAYQRRFDVEVQLSLARPDVTPVCELGELASQVLAWERTL